MMESTIEYLRTQFEILAKKIDVPKKRYPLFGKEDSSGSYILVELDSAITYSYNFRERNELVSSKKTDSQDELFYWIFADIAFEMGFDYAAEYWEAYSVSDQRILAYPKSEELIGRVNSAWFQRFRDRNSESLLIAPIDHNFSMDELEERRKSLGLNWRDS